MKKIVCFLLVIMWCILSKAQDSGPAITRIALYGLEHDHAWWMVKHIQDVSRAKLVAIADPHKELLEKAKSKFSSDILYYEDFEKMLDELKPDAVVITAPNNEHLRLFRKCAIRGIHCLVQKPMATTSEDAAEMARLARYYKVKLMINYYPLGDAPYQTLFEKWKKGELGQVRKMVMMYGHQGPKGIEVLTENYMNWLYNPQKHGGGALADQGTYGINYAVWVMGWPQSVYARIQVLDTLNNKGNDDDSWIVLGYPQGTVVIQGSWSLPFGNMGDLIMSGTKGTIRYSEGRIYFRNITDNPREVAPNGNLIKPDSLPSARKNNVAHFVDCIQNNKEFDPPFSPLINVWVTELTEYAYKSAHKNKVIMLKPKYDK